MDMNLVQYNEMAEGLRLPPFLINDPIFEGDKAMTIQQLPLFDTESQSIKKFCYGCNTEKDVSAFSKHRFKKDGLQTRCIVCAKEYYRINRVQLKQQMKVYRICNKETLLAQKKLYVEQPGVKNRINKWRRDRCKNDPMFRLNSNIHKGVSTDLKGVKSRRKWQSLVGYTLQDLRKHLEEQFAKGMTWDNYGEWHVDHKIPLAAHNFVSPEDLDFKRAWALKNLQPLWAHDNSVKHTKIDKPFQPSLAFGGTI